MASREPVVGLALRRAINAAAEAAGIAADAQISADAAAVDAADALTLAGTKAAATYGTANPNNANGDDNDIYVQIDSNDVALNVWQKASGTWSTIGDINAAWVTSYVPTVQSETGTITTYTATSRYRKVGNFIIYNGSISITNAGTGGGYIACTLPFPSIGGQNGAGHMFQNPVHIMLLVSTIPFGLAIHKYDGTTAITAPMGYTFSITYQTT